MKLILLPLLSLISLACFVGCTTIPTPRGIARFWGDYETVDLKDSSFHFSATGMKHSGVVRAHWRGGNAMAGQVVAGAIGFGNPAVGAGTAIIAPAVVPRVQREP